MEWKSDSIQVWSWASASVAPSDVKGANPDPTKWGKPHFSLGSKCDVARAFKNMRLVLNINFCGDGGDSGWNDNCSAQTKEAYCYKLSLIHI